MSKHSHILNFIKTEIWAITPEALQQIIAIAQGYGDVEAVASKLGKPLTNAHDVSVRDGVAIIPVIGPIFRYANLFTEISGATSIQTLGLDLQTATDDPNVKAIILEIDSPGGQVAGVSEFAAQVRAANNIKPVSAYISDLGASAAYWIASASGEIITSNTARVGSIGVVMQALINDSEGTVKFISSQSPLKHADPATETGKIQYQKIVDALAEVFIFTVAEYRGTTREAVIANFGLGGLKIAGDAINSGMADKMGSLELLISQHAGSKTNSNSISPSIGASMSTQQAFSGKSITANTSALGVQAAPTFNAGDKGKIGVEKWTFEFEHDASLKAEFLQVENYIAYQKAVEKGLIKPSLTRKSITADKQTPLSTAGDNKGKNLIGVEKWTYEFEHDASLKAEFLQVENYIAYQKAVEKGQVKIFVPKT